MVPSTPNLPRKQSGSNPQYLLITLLGDFWPGVPVDLPSAGIVALLGEFGISPTGARSALSRLSTRGVLTQSKQGRNTFYRLSDDVASVGARSLHGIIAFAVEDEDTEWDGTWTLVAFSIPEDERQQRASLRSKLRSHRYTPLQDGVWMSTAPPTEELRADLEEFSERYLTVFQSRVVPPDGLRARGPALASELDALAEEYAEFIEHYRGVLDVARTGDLAPKQAYLERVRLMSRWRGLYRMDPRLPASLLPANWRRREAGELFRETYDGLGPLAEMHCRRVLAAFELPDELQPRHYSASRVLAGGVTGAVATTE